MKAHAWIWTLCFVVLAVSCRKDKDDSPPQVTFLLPNEGATMQVPDTLQIKVQVSDDRQVNDLTILLLDADGDPIAAPLVVSVNASSATIERDMPVTSERLSGCSCTLVARVSDGNASKSAFRAVNILPAPLRLRAVFVTAPPGSTGMAVTRIDSLGAPSPWLTLNELGGAAVSSGSQHVFLAGTLTDGLQAMPVGTGALPWSSPNLQPGGSTIPYFQGLRLDPEDGRLYHGTSDGSIRGYRASGGSTFTANALQGHISSATCVVSDRLVSIQTDQVSGTESAVIYAYASGTLQDQIGLDLSVKELFRRTDQEVLLFGERNGTGIIRSLNLQFGGGSDLREFTEGPIASVARLDANNFAIALPDRIIRYNYPTNSATTLTASVVASTLIMEPATGILFAGVQEQLVSLDPLTGSVTGSLTLAHPIGWVLPLRNR